MTTFPIWLALFHVVIAAVWLAIGRDRSMGFAYLTCACAWTLSLLQGFTK